MTQEEILEYNKLCAEFLGMYDYSIDNKYFTKGRYFCYPEKEKNQGSNYFDVSNCFLKDWSWIHSLIEKIESLGFKVIIGFNNYCGIIKTSKVTTDKTIRFESSKVVKEDNKMFTKRPETKKECVVEVIYEFLKWYNDTDNR